MTTATFNVCFGFLVDAIRLKITLEADVQEHHSDTFFMVTKMPDGAMMHGTGFKRRVTHHSTS